MKRKLRLLVAVVLTLAMVMGMSVTVFAGALPTGSFVPDTCECSECMDSFHFYATGGTYTRSRGSGSVECAEGRAWGLSGDMTVSVDYYVETPIGMICMLMSLMVH